MKKILVLCLCAIALTGCNTVHVQPGRIEPGAVIYTTRGGYTMRPAVKQALTNRGYTIKIGKIKDTNSILESADFEAETSYIPTDAKYVLKVSESSEDFQPIFCAFNGFWWWRFYVSIVDQSAGDEILTWTGRGCANSSVRKLDRILDELEKSDAINSANIQTKD